VSPRTARTHNSNKESHSSQCNANISSQKSCKTKQKARVFSLLQKTGSDGKAHTDSGRLFQTDAARLPMVARKSADKLEDDVYNL